MHYLTIPGKTNEPFILFHGTGGNEYSLFSITGDINPNAPILSFLGNEGTGANRRYFKPLENSTLNRQDFEEKVNQFPLLWDSLDTNKDEATLMGYSNGANFILGLLEKRPNLAKKIVLLHPSDLNYTFHTGSDSAILITAGSTDTLSRPGDTLNLSKQLKDHFPATEFELLDGGHGVSDAEVERIKIFLQ